MITKFPLPPQRERENEIAQFNVPSRACKETPQTIIADNDTKEWHAVVAYDKKKRLYQVFTRKYRLSNALLPGRSQLERGTPKGRSACMYSVSCPYSGAAILRVRPPFTRGAFRFAGWATFPNGLRNASSSAACLCPLQGLPHGSPTVPLLCTRNALAFQDCLRGHWHCRAA